MFTPFWNLQDTIPLYMDTLRLLHNKKQQQGEQHKAYRL